MLEKFLIAIAGFLVGVALALGAVWYLTSQTSASTSQQPATCNGEWVTYGIYGTPTGSENVPPLVGYNRKCIPVYTTP